MDLKDINIDFHAAFLFADSSQGNTEAARKLVGHIADQLQKGEPLMENTAAFLGKALQKVADGRDANIALMVKRSEGQKNRSKIAYRDIWMCQRIREIMESHPGLKKSPAASELCSRLANGYYGGYVLNIDVSTLQKIYRNHEKLERESVFESLD